MDELQIRHHHKTQLATYATLSEVAMKLQMFDEKLGDTFTPQNLYAGIGENRYKKDKELVKRIEKQGRAF